MQRGTVTAANPATRTVLVQLDVGGTVSALCAGLVPATDAVVVLDEVAAGAWVVLGILTGTAWHDYTPGILQGGTVANTPTYVRFTIAAGGAVRYQGRVAVTGTGTALTAISIDVPLQMAGDAAVLNRSIGEGLISDASTGPPIASYPCLAVVADATRINFFTTTQTLNNYEGNQVFAAALASGDVITWDVGYQAAA